MSRRLARTLAHDLSQAIPAMHWKSARRLLAPLLILALSGWHGALGAQESAALLVQFRGEVKILRGAEGGEIEPRVGLRLQEGDRVGVPRGGRAVLLLKGGRLLTASAPVVVTASGVAQGSELFEETVDALDRVAGSGEPPSETEGGARPAPGTTRPLSPAEGVTILEARPTFAWTPTAGAQSYTIQIRPVDGGSLVRFQAGPDTTWSLPVEVLSLTPGREYVWTVVPGTGGRAMAQARFRVIGADGVARLTEFIASLEEQGVDPRGDGLFLAAVYFNELGLVYEARRALEALVSSGVPLGSEVHFLRAQVYTRLGDLEAARAAYREATAAG